MAAARVEYYDGTNWARRLNLVMKVGIVTAFAVALLAPLDHLDGKGMAFRAPLFCGAALVVPAFDRWRPRHPYPHVADALVVAPFLLDTLGNLAGVYDTFNFTDDVLHTVNWVLLVLAFHAFRFRSAADDRDAALLGAGFGALAIVAWEIAEWVSPRPGPAAGCRSPTTTPSATSRVDSRRDPRLAPRRPPARSPTPTVCVTEIAAVDVFGRAKPGSSHDVDDDGTG